MDIQFIERLERELEEELPGREAQFLMAPMERQQNFEIPDSHVLACVVALIFPKKKDWHVVLIERVSDNPNDHHAGQLSFPGGNLRKKIIVTRIARWEKLKKKLASMPLMWV